MGGIFDNLPGIGSMGDSEWTNEYINPPEIIRDYSLSDEGAIPSSYYAFHVNYTTKEFSVNQDRLPQSLQTITSKELAILIRDHFDNLLRKDWNLHASNDYIIGSKDGSVIGAGDDDWVIKIDKKGNFSVNWSFTPMNTFSHWILSNLDGMKIERK